MEHPADIRHHAHAVCPDYGYDEETGMCEASHIDPAEIRWFQDTIDDLLDELNRRPTA